MHLARFQLSSTFRAISLESSNDGTSRENPCLSLQRCSYVCNCFFFWFAKRSICMFSFCILSYPCSKQYSRFSHPSLFFAMVAASISILIVDVVQHSLNMMSRTGTSFGEQHAIDKNQKCSYIYGTVKAFHLERSKVVPTESQTSQWNACQSFLGIAMIIRWEYILVIDTTKKMNQRICSQPIVLQWYACIVLYSSGTVWSIV